LNPKSALATTDKAAAEGLLLQTISRHLDTMAARSRNHVKADLCPKSANHYAPLVAE
jgi:hypothetical protein